jgi:hypothetical protein
MLADAVVCSDFCLYMVGLQDTSPVMLGSGMDEPSGDGRIEWRGFRLASPLMHASWREVSHRVAVVIV